MTYQDREKIEDKARRFGLYTTTWAPGDGVKRYRFHLQPADYHDGTGIGTVLGRTEAHIWLNGYATAQHVRAYGPEDMNKRAVAS